MKVKELVKQLEAYDGEDELIVAYWDKNIITMYGAPDLTDEEWEKVVDTYENGEWYFQSLAAQDFVEIAGQIKEKGVWE